MSYVYRLENDLLELIGHYGKEKDLKQLIESNLNTHHYIYLSHEKIKCNLNLDDDDLVEFVGNISDTFYNFDEEFVERIRNGLISLNVVKVAYKYNPRYTFTPEKISHQYMIVYKYNLY